MVYKNVVENYMVIASLVKESLILLRRAMYNFIEKIAKISTYIILVFLKKKKIRRGHCPLWSNYASIVLTPENDLSSCN